MLALSRADLIIRNSQSSFARVSAVIGDRRQALLGATGGFTILMTPF